MPHTRSAAEVSQARTRKRKHPAARARALATGGSLVLTSSLFAGMALAETAPVAAQAAEPLTTTTQLVQQQQQPLYLRLPDGRVVAVYPSAGRGQSLAVQPGQEGLSQPGPSVRTHASR